MLFMSIGVNTAEDKILPNEKSKTQATLALSGI